MLLKSIILCMVYVLCLYFQQAHSLKCYDCSNQLDPKCGATWGYDAGDTTKLVECNDTAMACRKLEMYSSFIGDVVTRECWEPVTNVTDEYYMECQEYFHTVSCYCNATDACNGQERIRALPALATVGFVVLIYQLFL